MSKITLKLVSEVRKLGPSAGVEELIDYERLKRKNSHSNDSKLYFLYQNVQTIQNVIRNCGYTTNKDILEEANKARCMEMDE